MKMRLLLVPIVSIAIATMMVLGAQAAAITGEGILATKIVNNVGAATPPSYSIATVTNCSTWYYIVITVGKHSDYEWVVVSNQTNEPVSVIGAGELGVYFQSNQSITIKSFNLVPYVGTNTPPPKTLFGGVGSSYVVWYFGCSGTWGYTITTNYIPSQYYNSQTAITIVATAGSNTNTFVCELGT